MLFKAGLGMLVGVAVGTSAMAELTPIQTANFTGGEVTESGDQSETQVRASYTTPITGLQKFDPSLGTLTAVLLSIQVDATASVTLFSNDITDDQELFTLQHVDQPSKTFVQTQIAYVNGTTTRFVAITSGNLGTTGGTGLDSDDYSNPDFEYTDSSSINYGGFANGGSTPRTGQINSTDSFYNAADFVGVGEVTSLSVTAFTSIDLDETSFTLDNLSSAFITAFARVESGDVSLQYEYTPIPEPTSLAMTGTLAALLLHRRRQA